MRCSFLFNLVFCSLCPCYVDVASLFVVMTAAIDLVINETLNNLQLSPLGLYNISNIPNTKHTLLIQPNFQMREFYRK